MTNELLIEGILNENPVTYNWIYDTWYSDVKRYVKDNNGIETDAKDLFQNAITDLYINLKLKKFKNKRPLKNYFMMICRNKWLNHLRTVKKKKISNTSPDDITNMVDEDYMEQILFNEKRLNIVEQYLKKLSESCQAIFKAYFFEKKGLGQIAIENNWTDGYTKTKNYRCKKQLKKAILGDDDYQQLMKDK